MTTLGLIEFSDVEKEVMLFISRNAGKLCSIESIFNDIIEDRNIKNPEIKNDLKIKLDIVLRQLDSDQKNVTVKKINNKYLAGFNIKSSDNIPELQINKFDSTTDFSNTEQMAKSMFEYIIDNDINYQIKPDCNGENLLFIGIKLGDTNRVNKLINKYSMSFFHKNKDGISVLDLIKDNSMLKYCIKENNDEIKRLKQKEIELQTNIVHINDKISLLNQEILELKKKNTQRNIWDLYYLVVIFLILFKFL